MGIEAAVEATS